MKKILFFLDELYYKDNDHYISNYAAGSYFAEFKNIEKSFLFPVAPATEQKPDKFSTRISTKENKVTELPYWNSVISYLKVYYKSGATRSLIKETIRKAVSENDIIWIRVPALPGLLVAKEAIKQNKKIMFHFAGDIENAWKNNKYSGVSKAYAYMLSKYMHSKVLQYSKLDNVTNLCTGSALYNIFSKENKNTSFFIDSNIRRAELETHDYSETEKRFLYIGRLTEDKGILDLVDIFKRLGSKYQNIKLTIIGFGDKEDYIKQTISESENPDAFNFIGYVPNTEISNYLKQNDILLLPSKAPYEGFPRVILEAWAYGLSVIATRVGGVDGLGVDGKNIVFSNVGDVAQLESNIIDVIEDKLDIKSLQQNIIKDRENITYEYYKEIVEKHIDEL